MKFKAYSISDDNKHAFLSPSNYHWVNYTIDKLRDTFKRKKAAERGSELHQFARDAIRLRIKLPSTRSTLNRYVNDGIGYKMTPEQVLFFSPNAFGTADTISFTDGCLRIHDLKTGESPTSMTQLEIYAALFCLEYKVDPTTIVMELRIYQKDEIIIHSPTPENILNIMSKIIKFDKEIEDVKLSLEER